MSAKGVLPRCARETLRLAVVTGLAACMALGLYAVGDLTHASAQIHQYVNTDNERGLATWTFHFGTIQIVAIVLCALLIASAVFAAVLRGRWPTRGPIGLEPIVGVAVVVLSAFVVLGAARGQATDTSGGYDPSRWMHVCAAALIGDVLLAVVLAVVLIRGIRAYADPSNQPTGTI